MVIYIFRNLLRELGDESPSSLPPPNVARLAEPEVSTFKLKYFFVGTESLIVPGGVMVRSRSIHFYS